MSNPPDKYIAIPRTGALAVDLAVANAKADEGYRIVAISTDAIWMGNYQQQGN